MHRLTESRVTSEQLDQPRFLGEPRKIFICSTPRSGSYLLCRFMIEAGVGVPHEYFNPILMRQIAPRLGLGTKVTHLKWRARHPFDLLPPRNAARRAEHAFLRDYINALVPIRCQSGVFAAKMHFDQYLTVLDNPIGRSFLDGGLFVYLYREDLLRQAISNRFADVTGMWSIDDTITTEPQSGQNLFDRQAIDDLIDRLAEQDKGWRSLFAHNGIAAISISYENLCRAPNQFVEMIAEQAGLPAECLRKGYHESTDSSISDPTSPSKSEVRERYLVAARSIKGATPKSNQSRHQSFHFSH